MECKHGLEFDREGVEDQEARRWEELAIPMEAPPELEKPHDPWVAEQEPADWLGSCGAKTGVACASGIPTCDLGATPAEPLPEPLDRHESTDVEEEQSNLRLYQQLVEQILGYKWQIEEQDMSENMDVMRTRKCWRFIYNQDFLVGKVGWMTWRRGSEAVSSASAPR